MVKNWHVYMCEKTARLPASDPRKQYCREVLHHIANLCISGRTTGPGVRHGRQQFHIFAPGGLVTNALKHAERVSIKITDPRGPNGFFLTEGTVSICMEVYYAKRRPAFGFSFAVEPSGTTGWGGYDPQRHGSRTVAP